MVLSTAVVVRLERPLVPPPRGGQAAFQTVECSNSAKAAIGFLVARGACIMAAIFQSQTAPHLE